MKRPNKAQADGGAAEAVEERELAKGNPHESDMRRTQRRHSSVPSALERIREAARRERTQRFTALMHHVYDIDRLRSSYRALRKQSAAGVDGVTWLSYGEDLESNLQALSDRLKHDTCRAQAARRACHERCGHPACEPVEECVESKCLPESGCSDDTREGFPDRLIFPTIAGCSAVWPMASMRAARVQSACGNSLRMCNVPADACAPGWHVCGNAASGPADITAGVTSTECNTTPGRWAGALGDVSCEDCSSATASGSVCCGAQCVQQNNDCLWPGETAWFGVVSDVINLCTGTENPSVSVSVGVLCCRDASSGTKPGSIPDTPLF